MNPSHKIYSSAAIDFFITAGTAFLALPQDAPMTIRVVITIIVGAGIGALKGVKTYSATHPTKMEVSSGTR